MKRKSLIMVLLVTFCCVMVASCSFSNAKYVMGVEKNDAGDIVVTYSDGTTSTVTGIKGETGDTGAAGAVGPVGPKGDTGEQGEAGVDAKDLEFRFYKNKLWYRVIGTTTWKVAVTKVELDQEDLTYEDFLCSLYVKEKDFSLTVSTFASVNGAWCESKIAGNVLTVTTKASDGSNVYYDLVKTGEEFKLVTYAKEGVNETEVDYALNDSMDSFVGTYTIVDEEKNSYVVVVGASSVQFKVGAKTTYMGSYMKGSMLYCFDRSSKATIAISMVDGEASFVTKLDDGTGNFVELSKYVVTKWVDVSKLIGVYTLYVDGVEAFDFALKANNSLNLYDGKYPQYTYNVDTATFDQTGVSYHIQYTDAGFLCSSSVEGKVITVKKWDNYIGQLKKFATVDSSEVETNWIINDFGGVTKDGKYFGSAVQKKNVVTLSTTSSKESLVVTYADGKFSGKYTINGTTFTDVTIKLDATIEDFLGSYKVTFDYSGRESIAEFVIGPNPYSEGNYAFIIGENPMSYTLDAGKRTLTYINQRSGTGYRVTSNLDGSKSVISFSIGEGNVINETTIVSGVVEFKKLSE